MENDTKEYQKVIQYLRELISKGQLCIGSRLPTERELSEMLSVSRNSTREAIRTLENMGVIESRHGSGNYIIGQMENPIAGMIDMMLLLKKTDMDEICSFRCSLDKVVCMYSIENSIDEEVMKQLDAFCQKNIEDYTIEELTETDRAFHMTLIKLTGNRLWISISEAIITVYRNWVDAAIRNADKASLYELFETHKKIIESIKVRNRTQCEQWIEHHYDIVNKEMKRGKSDEV